MQHSRKQNESGWVPETDDCRQPCFPNYYQSLSWFLCLVSSCMLQEGNLPQLSWSAHIHTVSLLSKKTNGVELFECWTRSYQNRLAPCLGISAAYLCIPLSHYFILCLFAFCCSCFHHRSALPAVSSAVLLMLSSIFNQFHSLKLECDYLYSS